MKRIITALLSLCVYASTVLSASGQVAVVYRTVPPPLIQSHLIADYRFTEGYGQQVLNKVGSGTRTKNLLGSPEQYFAAWSEIGFTQTEAYAANPIDSNTTATRQVCGAGNNYVSKLISLSAGTYTYSVYLKSNTGSSQTVRFGLIEGFVLYSADQTVTTSWQRFTVTISPAGSVTEFVGLSTDAGGDALDVAMYGPQLEFGGSATAYVPAQWDLQLGLNLNTDNLDPAWETSGITTTASSFEQLFGVTTSPIITNRVTIQAVIKLNALGNLSPYSPIFGEDYNSANLNLLAFDSSVPTFKFSGESATAGLINLVANGWHVMSGTYDGTTLRFYLDDTEVGSTASAGLSSVTLRRLFVGCVNGSICSNVSIGALSLYDAALTATEIRQNVTTYQSIMACRSVAMTHTDRFVVFEGDSITAAGLYTAIALQSFTPKLQGRSFGIPGSGISDLVSRQSSVDNEYYAGRRMNILSVFIGANNQSLGASAFVAALKSYCQARQAAGFKVILYTLLPQTTAGFNTFRNSANAQIRADNTFYDYLGDWGADSTIGCDACAANTTYYSDGLHPTTAGHAIMAPYTAAGISAF